MRHKAKYDGFNTYYLIIGFTSLLLVFIEFLKFKPDLVEEYYSRSFYPAFSFLYTILFAWVPFSIGDVFYAIIIIVLAIILILTFKSIVQKNWYVLKRSLLQLVSIILILYTVFYVNWGLNYYRVPIAQQFNLSLDSIAQPDHLEVLSDYISIANGLRDEVYVKYKSKTGTRIDIVQLVRQDTVFDHILSKTQLHIKEPLSNKLTSHFTVSGYFNPFTQEVQVNRDIPDPGFPFTSVHELAHQQGIGFEDECNFIAFVQLANSDDLWYRYSAYYSAIQYLMQPLNANKTLFNEYKYRISEKVRQDLLEEQKFWESNRGWLDRVSSLFYNQYLMHNNQPEGLNRYSMMTRLLVAWEKKQKGTN